MTVNELIAVLERIDPDSDVIIHYGNDLRELHRVEEYVSARRDKYTEQPLEKAAILHVGDQRFFQ